MPEPTMPTAKRRPGRPPKPPEERAKNHRSRLSLDGPIPRWIGYVDLKALIRQYRGAMYDERNFKLWVENGEVPSFIDSRAAGTAQAGVRRRRYEWEAVRAWIDSTMIRAEPAGIVHNGTFKPRKAG